MIALILYTHLSKRFCDSVQKKCLKIFILNIFAFKHVLGSFPWVAITFGTSWNIGSWDHQAMIRQNTVWKQWKYLKLHDLLYTNSPFKSGLNFKWFILLFGLFSNFHFHISHCAKMCLNLVERLLQVSFIGLITHGLKIWSLFYSERRQ